MRQILAVGNDQIEPLAQDGRPLLRRLRLPRRQCRGGGGDRPRRLGLSHQRHLAEKLAIGRVGDDQRAAVIGRLPATIEVAVRAQQARIGKVHEDLRKSRKLQFILCSMRAHLLLACLVLALLAACGSTPPEAGAPAVEVPLERPASSAKAHDVVIYALSLIDTGYRFGGKNPEAGLDCSGMVSYIYRQAAGVRVSGSAADIARRGRPIERDGLRPGDLVFFNTRNATFSHVGIYIGDDRFIHAPSSNGRVRIDQLGARYYAQRFESARHARA